MRDNPYKDLPPLERRPDVKDQRILRVVVKKNDTSEENESDEKSENKKSE